MTFKQYKIQITQNPKSKKLNFETDDREHYVYRVTDYSRTEKQHYIGSHTPKKGKKYNNLVDEFWTYKTSSKYNTLNEDKKEQYKIKILKVFDNPADKMIYEAYLHQYFNVKLNNKFWNESNQTPFGYDTTGVSSWNKGIEQSNLKKLEHSLWNNTICKNGKTNRENIIYKMSIKNILMQGVLYSKQELSTKKMLGTRNKEDENGINSYKKSGRKISVTRLNDKWKNSVGKESIRKCKESKQALLENGLTIQEQANRKLSIYLIENSPRYNIEINNKVIVHNVTGTYIRGLYQGLYNTNKTKYLGQTKRQKSILYNKGLFFLIGAYILKRND